MGRPILTRRLGRCSLANTFPTRHRLHGLIPFGFQGGSLGVCRSVLTSGLGCTIYRMKRYLWCHDLCPIPESHRLCSDLWPLGTTMLHLRSHREPWYRPSAQSPNEHQATEHARKQALDLSDILGASNLLVCILSVLLSLGLSFFPFPPCGLWHLVSSFDCKYAASIAARRPQIWHRARIHPKRTPNTPPELKSARRVRPPHGWRYNPRAVPPSSLALD